MNSTVNQTRYRDSSKSVEPAHLRILNLTQNYVLPRELSFGDQQIPIPTSKQIIGEYLTVPSKQKKFKLFRPNIEGFLELERGRYYTLAIFEMSDRNRRALNRKKILRDWRGENLSVMIFEDITECASPKHVYLRFINLTSTISTGIIDVYLSGKKKFSSVEIGRVDSKHVKEILSSIHPLKIDITKKDSKGKQETILENIEIELYDQKNYTLVLYGDKSDPQVIIVRQGEEVCHSPF